MSSNEHKLSVIHISHVNDPRSTQGECEDASLNVRSQHSIIHMIHI